MRYLVVDLEQEDDFTGFLGVTLEWNLKTGLIYMKHNGIIQRVIEEVFLNDVMPKGKLTPSGAKLLVKDDNGEPASGVFSYRIFVGILLYLYRHTLPNVALAVNFYARYIFSLQRSHGLALKILERYLKQTKDHGLLLGPNQDVCKVVAYPDDDFWGIFVHENHTDPSCVKSRTGFIITFSDCPVLWFSKLHTHTAL